MSAKRDDVHAPVNLVTEDYEFAYAYDRGTGGSMIPNLPILQALQADGWHHVETHDGGGQCDHCGARIRYVGVLKHLPTKTLIHVGEQCLDNRFALATPEFHKLRKAAALDRKRQRIVNARRAWFAVDPDREVAFTWASEQVEDGHYGKGGFRHTFVHNVNRYGSTSDKFVRSIMREMARTERIAAERAAEKALAKPVVAGKGQVTGEVLAVKWQDNAYGGRVVMTVREDRGFLVWGTVPGAISEVVKGERVTFSATVEASDSDPTFGFFRRPTKARVLDAEAVAVAA